MEPIQLVSHYDATNFVFWAVCYPSVPVELHVVLCPPYLAWAGGIGVKSKA